MDQNTFKCHPIYNNYEASADGKIRHKQLMKNLGRVNCHGYMQIGFRINGEKKGYLSSRFIWECFNGLIPDGLVIDHINRNRTDNRLENLRLVTPRENNLNSAPRIKSKQRKPVIGVMDIEELFFPSVYSAGKYYDANRTSIKYVADGIQNSAYSRKFKTWVSFIYDD